MRKAAVCSRTTPRDIAFSRQRATLAIFLASEDASHMSGQCASPIAATQWDREQPEPSDGDAGSAGQASGERYGTKPRRETQDTPDSLPKREEGTDVIPDDVRRTDPSQRILPDSLPPLEEQSIERADGRVARHPIHDHDL